MDLPAAVERARSLLTIHAGLRLLFPDDQNLRWTWVSRRNLALGGSTPLEVMLAGDTGIGRVLQLIRQGVGT
ncbi:antitoxin Xre/MbcA/ParS toxin-binding domain-containing protein [Cognatilysobacter segetis]|uniref:antitoxin Xre/MbcA/ParS toxin-binding domain-containing protein n=1 Tax=Cognatilysobacter segetis TaxID=2492394 RepID=UPI003CCD7E02